MDIATLNKDLVLDKEDFIKLVNFGVITQTGWFDPQGNPQATKLSELWERGEITQTYEWICEVLNKQPDPNNIPVDEDKVEKVTEIVSTEDSEETIPLNEAENTDAGEDKEDVEETDKITPVVVEENELED